MPEPGDGADERPRTSSKRSPLGMLRRVPTPIVFAVAIAIAIGVLWHRGAIDDVRTAISEADRTTLLTGLILYPAALALLCFRWHVLVRMIHGASHAPRASEAFLTSVALNYTAPVSVASASRALLTKRALGLSATETSAVALWEVAADVGVLGLGGAAWLVFSGEGADVLAALPGNAFIAAGVLVAVLLLGALVAVAFIRRRPRLQERLQFAALTILTSPSKRPALAFAAVAISVLYWFMQGVVLWTLLRAVTGESDPMLALGFVTLPVVLGMLSGLPGGAGIREALMVAVADAYGANPSEALVAAVTYRIALFAAIPILYGAVRIWLMADPGPQSHGTMLTAPGDPE
ncbi:MAG TPA: lysylphosphatidylglycerol synthase transmembrane domain-containing protein [Thermomicrobiales bacterium]